MKRQPLLEQAAFQRAFMPRPKQATNELPINQPVDPEQTLNDLEAVLDKNPVKAIGWWKANRP